MQQVVAAYTGKFDANTEAGFNLFLQNPQAFNHYWTKPDLMAKYFECLAPGEYGVDVEAFMAVRRSLNFSLLLPQQKSRVRAISFFGEQEHVVSPVYERQIIDSHFANHQTYDVPAAGHYVHFEQADFVQATILGNL
jgi:pimeloyl-ACP methyl ester carboxylesterase